MYLARCKHRYQMFRFGAEPGPRAAEETVVADEVDGELETFDSSAGRPVPDDEAVRRRPGTPPGGAALELLGRPRARNHPALVEDLHLIVADHRRLEHIAPPTRPHQFLEPLSDDLTIQTQPPDGVRITGEHLGQ